MTEKEWKLERSEEEERPAAHLAGAVQPHRVRHLGLLPRERTALKGCQSGLGQAWPKHT